MNTEPQTTPDENSHVERCKLRPEFYNPGYLGDQFQRLASYRQQLLYSTRGPNNSYLVVGKGDGFTVDLLKQLGKSVTVLDLNPNLGPDVLGSVDDIPLGDESFDATICCQVLEHLPYEKVPVALGEMRRVTRRVLILSVPDVRRFGQVSARFGKLGFDFQFSVPRIPAEPIPASRLEKSGHFWEIGFKGFPYPKVRDTIRASGWKIKEVRRVPELSWHTFFYLEK